MATSWWNRSQQVGQRSSWIPKYRPIRSSKAFYNSTKPSNRALSCRTIEIKTLLIWTMTWGCQGVELVRSLVLYTSDMGLKHGFQHYPHPISIRHPSSQEYGNRELQAPQTQVYFPPTYEKAKSMSLWCLMTRILIRQE